MLASIRKKLMDNSTSTDLPSESAPLSRIPWSLVVNSSSTDNATPTSAASGKDEEDETSANGSKHAHSHFPTASYLDLRRQQNEAWAEERLVEGIALAKTPATRKQAEECYQQGLEIAPNHSNLLTAYGALCANQGDKGKAIELLNKALQVDPDHEQAKLYRDTILNREKEKEGARQEGKIGAASNPRQNEEEEEEEQGVTGKGNEKPIHIKASKEDPGTKGYSLVEEPSNEDELQSQSTSHRQRKRKRKKKKRKKKHSDSGSDEDSSSTDSRERRRRRKRRKKKRRKRRRERDLSSSISGSSEGEEGSQTSSTRVAKEQEEKEQE